jgi:predicted Zn-ribbon and HTH transcriptional regulator
MQLMAYFTFNTNIPLPRTAEELQDRIKSLFAIRTELDREIESLMGVKAEAAKPYHCVRCDYKWKSRLAHRPKMCPRCRIKKFDRPPLYTYEEKIQRKKELLAEKEKVVPSPMPHSVLTRSLDYPNAPTYPVSTEADSIQNVSLTPPPVPMKFLKDNIPMGDKPTMSLRERLAMMSKGGDDLRLPSQEMTTTTGQLSNGAAADGAHLESNESATEEELLETINGDE